MYFLSPLRGSQHAQTIRVNRSSAGGATGTVIELDHVSKRFGEHLVVDDADFDVRAGEFFSLLGPSGCGKTTTLRMIAGFEVPTSGRVILEGKDVSNVPPHRRNVNTVFQHYALFPHMNVHDNVAFGPRSRKLEAAETERRVSELLSIVRLSGLAQRRPAQLSGGEQQRVALARALVNYPSALLLDEPLGALDLKLRQAMQSELKRIQKEVGTTFIYVTHDQEEALTMSDRIAVMNQGRVEQIGTPHEVYHEPATTFVAGFIGVANLLAATVVRMDGNVATAAVGGAEMRATVGGWSGKPGDAATIMIRPERIRLSSTPFAASTSIPVTVASTIFEGPVLRVTLRASDGTEMIGHIGPENGISDVRVGQSLLAGWREEAARLLP